MIQKQSIWSLIALFFTLKTFQSLQRTSAMQMCDSSDCELQLMLYNSAYYYFYIPINHLVANKNFYICMRTREVTDGDSTTCTLDGLLNSYTCLQIIATIVSSTVSSVTMNKFTSDATLLSKNKTDSTTYASTNSIISTTQVQIDIKSLIQTNKIYELYVGYEISLRSSTRTKNGFFMTFQIQGQNSSDNLLMQRNVACSLFYYKQYKNYNLLFYGGAIRGTNQTMFLHALSYLTDYSGNLPLDSSTKISTINLNVWVGLTFSAYGHPGRDAIVFISDNSSTMDMYSIYYAAPYYDVSPNIQGTFDVIDMGDSNIYNQGKNVHYYWTGASRKYVTGDDFGDETIIKKMNSTISYSIAYNPSTGPYSPALAANKHDFYNKFPFNVELWQPFLLICLLNVFVATLLVL